MQDAQREQMLLPFAIAEASAAERKRMLGMALRITGHDDTAHALALVIYEQSKEGSEWWQPQKGAGPQETIWGPTASRSMVKARQTSLHNAGIIFANVVYDVGARPRGTIYGINWAGIRDVLGFCPPSATRTVPSATRTVPSATRTVPSATRTVPSATRTVDASANGLPCVGAGAKSESDTDDDEEFFVVVRNRSAQTVVRDAEAFWRQMHGRETVGRPTGKALELLMSLAAAAQFSPRHAAWVKLSVEAASGRTDSSGRPIEKRGGYLKTCCSEKVSHCFVLSAGDDNWRWLGRLLDRLRPHVYGWLSEVESRKPQISANVAALDDSADAPPAKAWGKARTREIMRRVEKGQSAEDAEAATANMEAFA